MILLSICAPSFCFIAPPVRAMRRPIILIDGLPLDPRPLYLVIGGQLCRISAPGRAGLPVMAARRTLRAVVAGRPRLAAHSSAPWAVVVRASTTTAEASNTSKRRAAMRLRRSRPVYLPRSITPPPH